jgi:hypothetical protein
VTLDYFRYRDDSSEDSESESGGQRGDFVAGGIYAPPAQSITAAAAGLTLSIATAVGIKRLLIASNDTENLNEKAESSHNSDNFPNG